MKQRSKNSGVPTLLDHSLDRLYTVILSDVDPIGIGELDAVLAHQLDTRIADEIGNTRSEASGTFRDLFREPRPSLTSLRNVKAFAKRALGRPSNLPYEIYKMLYLASVVTALIRYDQGITRMRRDALRANLRWALAQGWLDRDLASLFREGAKRLECQ